jgi:hypothetical protein
MPVAENSQLQVLIGAMSIVDSMDRPSLVVDAEGDNLEALRQRLGPGCTEAGMVLKQAALSASSPNEVIWFHFNDARLNGIVPIERWQPFYPNVQLIEQLTLSSQTLSEILGDWPGANDKELSIDITIAQGDPLQVLGGAGEWLHRLKRIQIQGPRAKELWWESCDPWLQEQGFRPDSHQPLCWYLDPLAVRLAEHQEKANIVRLRHEQELQEYREREERMLAAIRHVFPYTAYKEKRPDIAHFSDEKLVDHFIFSGMNEDVNLQFSSLDSELRQLRVNVAEQSNHVELLIEKSRHVAFQLDLLKELVARFMKS